MSGDEALLAGVVDFLPLGVWIARAPGGEFVFANRVFREIMGMDVQPGAKVGGYAEPYRICGRDGQPYPEDQMPFVRALAARQTVTVDDIVIHRPDDTKAMIRATARPIFDGDVITHVVIAFEDWTAEYEAATARREASTRLRHAQRLESLGTLASGVAHDFNNLLGTISLISSMLRMRETDPSRMDDLRRIEAATDSATRLTRSLLAFGRQAPVRSVRFDTGDVAASVAELIRRTFDRGIEIVLERVEDAAVVGDPAAIEQLLMNLALNARDAMPDGGRLVLRVARTATAVTVEVEDSGEGVPPEIQPRIFEPYFSTKEDREGPGRGLGLATVYGVVEGHRGTITVRDAVPHGAIFRIELPYAPPRAVETAPEAAVVQLASPDRATILVVDDEPLVRSTIRRALAVLGYRTMEAADGVAAIEVLDRATAPVDAILLDSVMPRRGGRETLLEIMRRPSPPPVAIMGGRVSPREHDELIELGAAAILAKPFDVQALSELVAALVGRRDQDARLGG